jgi:hypothetical protein
MLEEIEYERRAIQGHTSPNSAILHARAYHSGHIRNDIDACKKQIVIGVEFGDLCLRLHFSANLVLEIYCSGNDLRYRVGMPGAAITSDSLGRSIRLRSGEYEFRWDRESVIQSLAGHEFRNVFIGPDGIYLYFDRPEILSVRVLIRSSDGSPFLYWHLGD